jgi:hypothetical protein
MSWCRTELCVDDDALALRGFDPVSYFSKGGPQRGCASNALIWHGALFQFRCRRNQRLFLESPRRYLPQYGGHCALSMSEGRRAEADPTVWLRVDDRVYLAQSRDALFAWMLRREENVEKADAAWSRLVLRFG